MQAGRAVGAGTPFEWPAAVGYDRQPYAMYPAGPWALAACPAGLVLGTFCWIDPDTGEVFNAQAAGRQLGFSLPTFNWWNVQRVRGGFSPTTGRQVILRGGIECVVAIAGDFITTFPLGGQAGRQVWADPLNGDAYDSDQGGSVPTPWTLMQNGGCLARLRISSWARPVVN